jgi:hypothetical protein
MKFVTITLLLICLATGAICQKINSDAITAFWHLVDRLEQDKPLTDTAWSAYYDLFGNRNYMVNNRSMEDVNQHRRYLEIVFRPSFSDSLRAMAGIKNKDKAEGMFQNLWFIKQNEARLRKYSQEIASPAYLLSSIALAKSFLPKDKYNSIPGNLKIYIMAMAADAAVQDSSMYFGLSVIFSYDQFRKGAIAAHELHHVLRKEKVLAGTLSSRDSASFYVVDDINNEGCADLIDKVLLIDHGSHIIRGDLLREKLLSTAGRTIRVIDSCLLVNAGSQTSFTSTRAFNRITNYSSGHIPGFYMMLVIKRNGYLSEMIDHCDDPFSFFDLYNKAAKKDKENPPCFSDATMAYLKELERRSFRP